MSVNLSAGLCNFKNPITHGNKEMNCLLMLDQGKGMRGMLWVFSFPKPALGLLLEKERGAVWLRLISLWWHHRADASGCTRGKTSTLLWASDMVHFKHFYCYSHINSSFWRSKLTEKRGNAVSFCTKDFNGTTLCLKTICPIYLQ